MSDATTAQISVIVPAHAAGSTLNRSLASLARLAPPPGEILVVDDSGDGSCAAGADALGFRTLTTSGHRGPAFARNRGAAAARGDILLFFDSDVAVPPDVVRQVAGRFASEPDLAALIGSYDESPADAGFLSRYKNLVHRFIHQTSAESATTFWGACGAVRRSAFDAVGGFDERFVRPSIEDIELGNRLTTAGYRISMDREFQITHLKRWTIGSLMTSDIRDRAVPWTRLIAKRGRLPNDFESPDIESSRRSHVMAHARGDDRRRCATGAVAAAGPTARPARRDRSTALALSGREGRRDVPVQEHGLALVLLPVQQPDVRRDLSRGKSGRKQDVTP